MARAHDHVCEVCHLPCSGAGILKDSRDRYFHRECYQHAVARKGMKGNIAPSRAVGTKPGGEPQWRVGDHVSCTHPKCNASFRIATAEVAAAGSLACPRCKSPLKRTTAQSTDAKPKPSAEPPTHAESRSKPRHTILFSVEPADVMPRIRWFGDQRCELGLLSQS